MTTDLRGVNVYMSEEEFIEYTRKVVFDTKKNVTKALKRYRGC